MLSEKNDREEFLLEKISGNTAALYRGKKRLEVPAELVACCEEGCVLILRNGVYVKDEEATAMRRRDIFRLQESLFDR